MLSDAITRFCKDKKWWFDDVDPAYRSALLKMGFDISSDFAQFYVHVEDGPTFTSRNGEIYQICWFLNHSDYDGRLRVAREVLKIPASYVPLDAFPGGRGYFYDTKAGGVFDVGLGNSLEEFVSGNMVARWSGFNEFIEWFFDI
ncbi:MULTISPECIES: hypothetical protein [Burkholderia]|uniref:hypothetical protein n=1 Tax=Burkholderia TaxID=32008 RepID=UPI001581AE5E|nr:MULTISPECIES: hypothetical protein [Burkholderia]